jgi:hypothetical protein
MKSLEKVILRIRSLEESLAAHDSPLENSRTASRLGANRRTLRGPRGTVPCGEIGSLGPGAAPYRRDLLLCGSAAAPTRQRENPSLG